MNNVRLIFLCLSLMAGGYAHAQTEASADPQSPTQFKVLSYNLRFGELASLADIAAYIVEEDPDIVALQEVDCRTYRERAPAQHGKDFATELAFRTGMIPAYGKTIPYAGGYYGIAILSKYPLQRVERIYLPKTGKGKEQRAVLVADVEYREGACVTFASTHLDYTHTEERQVQVEKLNAVLLESPYPVIVAGDFNATPDSKEIDEGMVRWKTATNLEPTSPADNPRKTIDYIFCYPNERWRVKTSVTPRVGFSDHLPVSAVIELKPRNK